MSARERFLRIYKRPEVLILRANSMQWDVDERLIFFLYFSILFQKITQNSVFHGCELSCCASLQTSLRLCTVNLIHFLVGCLNEANKARLFACPARFIAWLLCDISMGDVYVPPQLPGRTVYTPMTYEAKLNVKPSDRNLRWHSVILMDCYVYDLSLCRALRCPVSQSLLALLFSSILPDDLYSNALLQVVCGRETDVANVWTIYILIRCDGPRDPSSIERNDPLGVITCAGPSERFDSTIVGSTRHCSRLKRLVSEMTCYVTSGIRSLASVPWVAGDRTE